MIQIHDLHKTMGQNPVLRGLNLEIKKGKTVVVIGQSGSGKSVLIKHLMGLLKPDKGKIVIDGKDISRMTADEIYPVRKKFGILFQNAALFDSMTVGENVAFGVERYLKVNEEEKAAVVRESLAMVGLYGIEHLMPHELSGGMKKRVGLARVIAYKPEIIYYDEPSTGIDPIRADAINDLINMLKKEMKVTSIVITHDMTSAYKVADMIAMLYEGKIIETGNPEEIKKSKNQIVQQFIHGCSDGPIKNF
ncbi:MAG: ABC transporter ATP-binding protein [Candidatus Aminicenantes bacterium]|nr:ABC transporter ATP-binding protein [Candidatus Aminicenantes bacterium]